MIAALLPAAALATKSRSWFPKELTPGSAARIVFLIAVSLKADIFDFVLRQKLQGQSINLFNFVILFILEQLPAIATARFNDPLPAAFTQAMRAASLMNGHHANPSVADVVIPRGLALSSTAHGHGTVRA